MLHGRVTVRRPLSGFTQFHIPDLFVIRPMAEHIYDKTIVLDGLKDPHISLY